MREKIIAENQSTDWPALSLPGAHDRQVHLVADEGSHLKVLDDGAEDARFTADSEHPRPRRRIQRQAELRCRVLPQEGHCRSRVDQHLGVLAIDLGVDQYEIAGDSHWNFAD